MIESLREHFSTDWAALSGTDWFGIVTVVSLSLLMAFAYFWVFWPRNKDKLESHRDFVLKDDLTDGEK